MDWDSFDQHAVLRRFLSVGGRRVHGRVMGSGPPALFIHSSPANSGFVLPEMALVADRFTCFAFDSPGFGLSDPLPGDVLTIPMLADALAETLETVGMPPCPVFGCHTGSAIALELAVRHPARVTGLMLDSLSCFTAEEFAAIDAGYFARVLPDPLGGHYAATWTRFRDQSTWFPWFARHPEALNEADLASAAATHRWVAMYFDAQDHYAPAYRAAMAYRNGPDAIRRLAVPMVLTSIESDMLYPHLDRVAPSGPEQRIVRAGASAAVRRALTARTLKALPSAGQAPVLAAEVGPSERVMRQFIDVAGRQLLVRTQGDTSHPPLVLIHDVPGSGAQAEPWMAQLSRKRFVVTFDLPGCGESLPLETGGIAEFADCLWSGVDALGFQRVALGGVGFGSSLAVEMAARHPERTSSLLLDGLLLPSPAERAELAARFAPRTAIEPDGAHWFRTWQMIRDMGVWWPWFTPTRAALRRVPADFDARSLHLRTCDTLRQLNGYAAYAAAALEHDVGARLESLRIAVTFVSGSHNPVATAYEQAARARFPQAEWRTLES